jgi:hypothetical protein
MTADVRYVIATNHRTKMGELMSVHPSLLDRTIFRYTFYQKFSPNHIQTHISLNITQIYDNNRSSCKNLYMTIIEVQTPFYI